MEIKEFQKLLSELTEKTASGRQFGMEEIREYFKDADLTEQQIGSIIQYLRTKGNAVSLAEEYVVQTDDFPGTRKPLSEEDRQFLAAHIRTLEESSDSASAGPLKKAAEMAARYHCEELSLPDLVQEASLSALSALAGKAADWEASASASISGQGLAVQEEEIEKAIYDGICEAIRAQDSMLKNDRSLVSRVEKLDQAIKDLTDEGESLPSFSAAELAVILDTRLEDLRDILRLTGEEL